MQPDIITYVRHLVDSECANGLFLQRLRSRGVILMRLVDRLGQAASQYLHDAMSVCMIVDWRAFPGVPYEQ